MVLIPIEISKAEHGTSQLGGNEVKGVCAAVSLSVTSLGSIPCSLKGTGHTLFQLIRSVVQISHSCNNRTETLGTHLSDYSRPLKCTESNNGPGAPLLPLIFWEYTTASPKKASSGIIALCWWNANVIHSPIWAHRFSSPYMMRCGVMYDAVQLWIQSPVTEGRIAILRWWFQVDWIIDFRMVMFASCSWG